MGTFIISNAYSMTKSTIKLTTQTYKKIALTGYLSLLSFMVLWIFVLNSSQGLSIWLNSIMFILPLLFPLKGMLNGNPFTYAWANFILILYFLHSTTTLWVNADDRMWAFIELILAFVTFYGCTCYAKYRGQELGLSIRKRKEK